MSEKSLQSSDLGSEGLYDNPRNEYRLQKLKQVFVTYDMDGSGTIERSELPLLIHKLLPADGAYTQQELDDIWANLDTNDNGVVDEQEFGQFMLAICDPMKDNYFDMYVKEILKQSDKIENLSLQQKSTISKVFAKFDTNDSGDIDASEMVLLLERMTGEKPSEEEVQESLKALDVSGDGSIDLFEFTRYVAMSMDGLSEEMFDQVMGEFLAA